MRDQVDPTDQPPGGTGRLALLRRLPRPRIPRPRLRRGGLASLSSGQLLDDASGRDALAAAAADTAVSGGGGGAAWPAAPSPPPLPAPVADALSAASAFVATLLGGAASASASDDDDDEGLDPAAWLAARCFPRRLRGQHTPSSATTTQDLLTVGSRRFPLAVTTVNIYDFAVFADAAALRTSAAAPALRSHAPSSLAFGRALRSADDVPMALVVRMARTLPVPLLRAEYARILGRRIARVGGDPADAALRAVVSHFRADALPASARTGLGNVRKGTLLEFRRGPGGEISAAADGHHICTVKSPALAAAVFDIYLGDEPACPAARQTAHAGAAAVVAGARLPRVDGGGLVCARGVPCAGAQLD